jgi:pimeloyl-ACP methyl ester carboxylesterase
MSPGARGGELQSLRIGDHRLEIAWAGSGSKPGPVIVMLHEGLGCVAMWRDFPEEVSRATGLRVLVYSRLGYGGSDPVALPRPLTDMPDGARVPLP